MIPEFTIVVAVDHKHLHQLSLSWKTWEKNKPSLLDKKLIVMYDDNELDESMIREKIHHPRIDFLNWSKQCANSYGNGTDKWYNPQRYKMLASFVHGPPTIIETPYWLKIDTDAIAMTNDEWIDPSWFKNEPAIISHPWGFTRPANQMMLLDKWVDDCRGDLVELYKHKPLKLEPKPGWDRVSHKRIGSWCAFFKTDFCVKCSTWATNTCGRGLLPVPSQDGYTWYCATRLGLKIVRTSMKKRGWNIWHTMTNIKNGVEEALSSG